MFFWPSCARTQQIAEYIASMRTAESELLKLSHNFKSQAADELHIQLHDTTIPQSTLPIKNHGCHVYDKTDDYTIHGVRISSTKGADGAPQKPEDKNDASTSSSVAPLVLLHGYMNGSSYFYRNFAGLSRYFPSVYSLDWLGWGLSSRPTNLFDIPTVEHTEDVFCESLEAWRAQNNIDKMVLAGHSMGGYLSVAYCERYPQHVEKLVLISPVGVPDTAPPGWQERQEQQGFRTRMFFSTFRFLFDNEYTPGSVLRTLPKSRTRSMVENYVKNRLPAIEDDNERQAVADYLFYNAMLPGSAEYCVSRLLTTPFLLAKQPLVHRIPKLQVQSVTFLYGSHDWMDCTGGLKSQLITEEMKEQGVSAPKVSVHRVDRAGHLLMLDNYQEFNAGVALASSQAHDLQGSKFLPVKMCPRRDMPSLDLTANHEFSRVQNRVSSRRQQSPAQSQTNLNPEPAVE